MILCKKRKPFLDQLMEGLQDFKLADCIKMFPKVFEPMFVNSGKCEAKDVIYY